MHSLWATVATLVLVVCQIYRLEAAQLDIPPNVGFITPNQAQVEALLDTTNSNTKWLLDPEMWNSYQNLLSGDNPFIFHQAVRPSVDDLSSSTSTFPSEYVSKKDSVPIISEQTVTRARYYADVLNSLSGADLICSALGDFFDANLDEQTCSKTIVNKNGDVEYKVFTINSSAGLFELEILGASRELVMKNENWVERHRLFVSFGFDSRLNPNIIVYNFEPMLKTTKNIKPINENLFSYISRSNESSLRGFQEQIKSLISAALAAKSNALAEIK